MDKCGISRSKIQLAHAILSKYLIGLCLLSTLIINTADAEQSTLPIGLYSYLFDNPASLSRNINTELADILGETKVRIVNGGLLNQTDFDEWSKLMGKDKAVKYQQAFYSAFAGDNGPKSLTNVRVTDSAGQNTMNCIISHPNTDWHLAWEAGGLNMSMQYGHNDYNLNDVAEFILHHETKHCVSHHAQMIINENLSDVFAALIYRAKHQGKTTMIKDFIDFRHYQIKHSTIYGTVSFNKAAEDHDSRHTLQKVIDLDFITDIKELTISEINSLANQIVSEHFSADDIS